MTRYFARLVQKAAGVEPKNPYDSFSYEVVVPSVGRSENQRRAASHWNHRDLSAARVQ